jgi:GT2 family glycosyltransferase
VPGISVVICAYTEERWNELVAVIESVQCQTLPPNEIIVVIDHNPQLLKWVQKHIPDVIVVENTETNGLSGARNSGIAAARSHILAFLDDDAVATPNWLMFLNEVFSEPQVLGVGGPVIPLWLDHKPAWLPEEFYWVVGCMYRGMPNTLQTIRNPIGANMSFRREIFEVVGGFRHEIGRVGIRPLGCEETELCIRARQQWPERSFLYQPYASVFHRVPGSRTNWRYFFSRCYFEGISKAFVSQYVGVKDGLASERIYTFRALPQGILHGVIDALFHQDLSGFARAGAILSGLTMTAVGYLVGGISSHIAALRNASRPTLRRRHPSKAPSPIEAQQRG